MSCARLEDRSDMRWHFAPNFGQRTRLVIDSPVEVPALCCYDSPVTRLTQADFMLRLRMIVCVLALVGCAESQETLPVPTLMMLPGQVVSGDGQLVTVTPTAAPPQAASTALPQVVGVPTPTPAYANLGTLVAKLTSGETRGGTFDTPAQSHVYVYSGTAGEYINLEMQRVSGDVDPAITLFGPSGAPLATDDDSGGSPNAMLRNIRLPEDGLYSIQAAGDGFAGGYSITLVSSASPVPITPTLVNAPPTATPVEEILTPTLPRTTNGQRRLRDHRPVIDELTRRGDFGRFPFQAADGEIVTIGASPLPGNDLKLKLEVFGPAGDLIATANSSTSNAGGDALVAPLQVLAILRGDDGLLGRLDDLLLGVELMSRTLTYARFHAKALKATAAPPASQTTDD